MRPTLALLADTLTATRALIALSIAPLVWAGNWSTVALLVAVAWVTDFADGRFARRSGEGTRLGNWDLPADTAVGASLLIGFVFRGQIPPMIGFGVLLVLGVLYLMGNVAASMLLQLSGYVPLLLTLWGDRPNRWWAPFLVAALVAVADWRRLFLVNIPAFFRGLAGRFESPWARPR